MARKRLLFLAEGATMQHFVRPLALADSVDHSRYEVHFHGPRRHARLLAAQPYATGPLDTIPEADFLANLARGAPLFSTSILRSHVEEDRRLIAQLKPDLVIGDLRFSLPVSAHLEGVRCAVLMNAYWSPFAQRRSVIPELPITRLIPPRWLSGVFRLAEPLALALHVRAINDVRREAGLARLPPDPRHMYTAGDHVLYPDVPEFIPTPGAPASHRYIGPCLWELPGERPAWWEQMVKDPRPKVFVTLGSSGPVRILPRLLAVLARLPVAVVLATSGRAPESEAASIYAAPLLPFSETAAASALVISHGGSSSLYPSFAAGTPVLGIPSNADQQISAQILAESRAGLAIRVEEASERRLTHAIARLLDDPRYREAAARWRETFARADTQALFARFLVDTLGVP